MFTWAALPEHSQGSSCSRSHVALPAGVDVQLPVGILLPLQPEAAESKCGKERLQERSLGSRALEIEIVKHQTGGGW